jgi:hypothetical protein
MPKVIELAVRTGAFNDVNHWYDIYTQMDERRDDIRRRMFAALVVTARYYLQTRAFAEAGELLQKAAITAHGNPALLKEVILVGLRPELVAVSTDLLTRFPPDSRGGKEFLSSEYAIEDLTADPDHLVNRGRTLLKNGIEDFTIYSILIRRSLEIKKEDHAETLLYEAIKKFPNRTEELKLIWDQKKKAAA